MLPMNFSVAPTSVGIRLRGAHAGCVKRDGVKTDKPLVDLETGKRIYWTALVFFPADSVGGQDVEVLARCIGDVIAPDGALVELVNPRVELDNRGFSLIIDGVKELKAVKS